MVSKIYRFFFGNKYDWNHALFCFPPNDTYRWSGWLGCQLESFEWRTLPAQTTRTLCFNCGKTVDIHIHSTRRVGLKVRTTWSVSSSGSFKDHVARVEELERLLRKM